MKKIGVCILAIVMVLSLCACNAGSNTDQLIRYIEENGEEYQSALRSAMRITDEDADGLFTIYFETDGKNLYCGAELPFSGMNIIYEVTVDPTAEMEQFQFLEAMDLDDQSVIVTGEGKIDFSTWKAGDELEISTTSVQVTDEDGNKVPSGQPDEADLASEMITSSAEFVVETIREEGESILASTGLNITMEDLGLAEIEE